MPARQPASVGASPAVLKRIEVALWVIAATGVGGVVVGILNLLS